MNIMVKGNAPVELINKVKYRAIAAAAIFFVPIFVSIILNLTATDDSQIKTCMNAATPEGIKSTYINKASDYIEKVKDT